MKKYLKPLYNSVLGIAFRNLVGFRPPVSLLQNEKSFLASDLFVWRTDQSYSTIFKASDILKTQFLVYRNVKYPKNKVKF